jgi:hypothetical protein
MRQQQPQQEHSWLSQQHSTLCVSSQPLDLEQKQLGASCEELDAFMVETQMVSGDITSVCHISAVSAAKEKLCRCQQPFACHEMTGGCLYTWCAHRADVIAKIRR